MQMIEGLDCAWTRLEDKYVGYICNLFSRSGLLVCKPLKPIQARLLVLKPCQEVS